MIATPILEMVAGDTGPNPQFTCKREDGTPINLTGATVTFRIRDKKTGAITNLGHIVCAISDALNGVVNYAYQAGDVPDGTVYYADVQITYSNGQVETSPRAVKIDTRPLS